MNDFNQKKENKQNCLFKLSIIISINKINKYYFPINKIYQFIDI